MASALAAGTTIERYRVEKVIGAGSMGDVFQGIDIDLKRRVAIKILAEKHRDNSELRARFVREARAVAAISHPNVVQVFTTGSYDDRPYIAMEFLDGTDLGTSVEERGPWTSVLAARAIRDAARGLEAAAKAGLIHRDVKPSNLVMLRDGVVKVTDFGLAKPVEPGDEPALTALGVVVGTPDYIAPEQARGDSIDERVDIYALGGTLYFLLAGMPPFRTGNPADDKYLKVVARHLKKAPPDARGKNPQADRELSRLAKTMMAKKPVNRPGYAELVEQLTAIVERLERKSSSPPRDPTPKVVGRAVGKPASRGDVSPTPYLGGAQGAGFASSQDVMAASQAHYDHDDDSAPTNVRIPSGVVETLRETDGDVDMPAVARPRLSRWLVAITVVSMLIFLTGLGLLLMGPMPEPRALSPHAPAHAPDQSDAGSDKAPPQAAPDAAAAGVPTVPDGMVLVRHGDGRPWFFAGKKPVTHDEFAELFPNQKRPNRKLGQKPVTSVSYSFAQAYARAQGRRLLTAAEWDAAAKNPAFVASSRRWEWVTGAGSDPSDKTRPVRSPSGAGKKSAKGGKDITFRVAADLTGAKN